jgi:hypothetical protein
MGSTVLITSALDREKSANVVATWRSPWPETTRRWSASTQTSVDLFSMSYESSPHRRKA